MANSFNISVKPEIAAAVVKIDAIDTVVDAIRATDVPGINTNINANETKIDTIDTMLNLVRFTDFPAIAAEINANETKIDTIDGIVDAIKLKTDLIPQNVRGSYNAHMKITALSDFQVVIDITGTGILYKLAINCTDGADTIELKLNIDGKYENLVSYTGDTVIQVVYPASAMTTANALHLLPYPSITSDVNLFNMHFDTSLNIQIRRSAGTAGNVQAGVIYILDGF